MQMVRFVSNVRGKQVDLKKVPKKRASSCIHNLLLIGKGPETIVDHIPTVNVVINDMLTCWRVARRGAIAPSCILTC